MKRLFTSPSQNPPTSFEAFEVTVSQTLAGPQTVSPVSSPRQSTGAFLIRSESGDENQFNFLDQPYMLIDVDKKSKLDETNDIDKFAGSLYESSAKLTTSGEVSSNANVAISD